MATRRGTKPQPPEEGAVGSHTWNKSFSSLPFPIILLITSRAASGSVTCIQIKAGALDQRNKRPSWLPEETEKLQIQKEICIFYPTSPTPPRSNWWKQKRFPQRGKDRTKPRIYIWDTKQLEKQQNCPYMLWVYIGVFYSIELFYLSILATRLEF